MKSLKEKLANYIINPKTQCHEWQGPKFWDGAAEVWWNHGSKRASRLVWSLHNGPIPDKLVVCHRCDNPGCVNYDHLFLGTQYQNILDNRLKQRKFGKQKITAKQVKQIKILLNQGMSGADIERKFNFVIDYRIISRIKNGASYNA